MLLQNLKLISRLVSYLQCFFKISIISLLTILNILPHLLIIFFCLHTFLFLSSSSYLVSSYLVSSSVCTRFCFRLLRLTLIFYHLIVFYQQACLSRSDLFVSFSPQYPDGLFSLTLLFKLMQIADFSTYFYQFFNQIL